MLALALYIFRSEECIFLLMRVGYIQKYPIATFLDTKVIMYVPNICVVSTCHLHSYILKFVKEKMNCLST